MRKWSICNFLCSVISQTKICNYHVQYGRNRRFFLESMHMALEIILFVFSLQCRVLPIISVYSLQSCVLPIISVYSLQPCVLPIICVQSPISCTANAIISVYSLQSCVLAILSVYSFQSRVLPKSFHLVVAPFRCNQASYHLLQSPPSLFTKCDKINFPWHAQR